MTPPAFAPTVPIVDLAIETHLLSKRFVQRIAVDSVDLRVPRGSAFGLLGHNGAGKTTLIRMLLGLTTASSGKMRLLGRDIPAHRSEVLTRVGAIVEQPSFHLHLTGRENLLVAAAVRGPETRRRIPAALSRVGLIDRADECVKGYSLGMRQRLGIARCLLADPELLILDEPTNGLDPAGMQELRAMIRELVDEEGRTVFISTHLLDEVEKVCDAAAIVDRGHLLTQGAIAELAAARRPQLVVGCENPRLALDALRDEPTVFEARTYEDGVRLVLRGDGRKTASRVNQLLTSAGISLWRLELVHPTLEHRFLEITNRLGAET
jgi:ABC-2 type transport system ATP-binding protein